MACRGRPASPCAPAATETERLDPTWARLRGGQGEGLPCLEHLDSDSEVRLPPRLPSGAFASPSALAGGGTGPDCGVEVAGGRAWFRAFGFFLTQVLSASHSGRRDPPNGVVRVDRERPASAGACAVPRGVRSPEASPHTHALFFKIPIGPKMWMEQTLLSPVAREGALNPSVCPRGAWSSDATFSHPSPTP